jgi:hypothetical protein
VLGTSVRPSHFRLVNAPAVNNSGLFTPLPDLGPTWANVALRKGPERGARSGHSRDGRRSCYAPSLHGRDRSWRSLIARNLFAILDEMTANLAELNATLAPLALIGGTLVAEAKKPSRAPRGAKAAASGGRRPISAKRRAAMRVQGQYMGAIRPLSAARRAQVKKLRASSAPRQTLLGSGGRGQGGDRIGRRRSRPSWTSATTWRYL